MKIPDVQLFVQALVYLAIFLTGFVVSIPLGLSNINFNGDCLLYADIKWTSDTEFTFTPSTASNCQFPIYYNVFACIFYGLAMFIYFGYAILRQGPDVGSQMWVMPFLLLSAGITVVSFISSCIISVGFKSLCDGLTEKSDSCSTVAARTYFKTKGYDATHFYAYLTIAELVSWIGFLCWILQVGLGIIRFVRNRRKRSRAQAFQDASASDTRRIVDEDPTA